jgi:hypothetical protein
MRRFTIEKYTTPRIIMYKDIYSTIYPLSDGAAIPTIAIYSGYDYQGVYCQVG